ncbi:MAG: MmgE/PrpD family protein [Desulfobacterales bacterium]|nr:MmgE/PrpD family protein [Desulfobacterales bacterium]
MTKTPLTLEDRLVDHLVDTGYENLDTETIRCCKKLLMDTLGVTFPGSRAPGSRETATLMKEWQSVTGASVLIHGFTAPPPLAALANSTMMHALDFDDTLDASALHTFVSVLPAALAAGQAGTGGTCTGRDLIAALVLGVDMVCRISLAISRPLSWIRTATCGSFGAAAAAGKILGLNREGLFDALGIAYSQTSGNAQGLVEGRLVKRMQPGFAASAGVTAAFLAQRGITGSRQFLTGPYGFYPLYEVGAFDPAPVVAALGEHQTICDLSIKPYPSCRMTHASIDAALALGDRISDPETIERIEVSVSSMVAEMVGKPFKIGPNPQVDAQFSIPYTTACALVRGSVFLGDFEGGAIGDNTIKRLADRVRVTADANLAPKDILPAAMTVTLADGQVLTHYARVPLGNPKNPMSDQQVREKFNRCLEQSGLSMTGATSGELIQMIENLEELSDIGELVRCMVCADTGI